MDDRATAQPPGGPHALRDASRGQRLQRVMADAGVASRRVCEQLIEAGRVKVNGQVVSTLPAWVDASRDRVLVDGQPLERPEPHLYIMLNKPARTLATPPEGPDDTRQSALEMVEHPLASRLFAAGRLDFEATGLLLLTNDGELANRVTHARYGVPKTYQMVVRGTMDEASLDRVNRAIAQVTLRAAKEAGVPRAARADLTIVARESGRTVLELTVRDGRAVLVRDTLAALGHPVKSMERVAIGPVRLRAVAVGQWRELERDELSDLRRVAAGKEPRSAAEKGERRGGSTKRRAGAATGKKRIAKRFRGIGQPVAVEKPAPASKPPRRGSASRAPAARPVARPARDGNAPGPRDTRTPPTAPDAPDRRRGRGPGVNRNRSKPAKPTKPADNARGEGNSARPARESDRPDAPRGPGSGPKKGRPADRRGPAKPAHRAPSDGKRGRSRGAKGPNR